MAVIGMGLLLIGFAFKMRLFHSTCGRRDVYEGAPTPLTGFMSVGVKAAAFAAFARVFFEGLRWQRSIGCRYFGVGRTDDDPGERRCLVQEKHKRMLAYSSIAHAATF